MENASKALLIAGGMLIALLVIGALVLMFNQIGDYEKAQSSNKKVSQVAEFNKEFIKYTYDDIKGYELISLINKAIDFNGKKGTIKETANSVDYNKIITINVNNINGFISKYGVSGKASLFKQDKYATKSSNDLLPQAISKFSSLESTYSLGVMSKLSANYDSIKTYKDMKKQNKSDDEIKISGGKSIKEITGRDINISLEDIEKYREYSEFKSSTFTTDGDIVYDGEQVVGFSFKFVK